jgi:hypothetical protein
MTAPSKPGHIVLAAALTIAAVVNAQAGAAPPTMALSPGIKLAFDFSSSANGGVPVGAFNNFAFVLDVNRPHQKLIVKPGQPRKDVTVSFDYAGCDQNQEVLLEQAVSGLAPGTATFVDYVDVEIIPTRQKDLIWSGGVCYGFRTATGWHWRLASTPLTYDPGTKMLRGRIWVKEPGVDALKLVFDYSVPTQSARSVLVTTQPVEINIVK